MVKNLENISTGEFKRTRCSVYMRVMGYYQTINQFNIGKKSEACSRTYFQESILANSEFCDKY